jgi:hypothetical protein
MSSGYKVTLESCMTEEPLVASLTSIMRMGGKPFTIFYTRLWRISTGAWYKPNELGRYVMINRTIHAELDAIIRNRKIKTAYGTEFSPWRKIKIEFIQEITK